MKHLIPLLLALNICYTQAQNLHAEWAQHPIVIDGNLHDWGAEPLRFFDNNTGFLYGFFNDNENIYLAFQAKELSTQMRFTDLGMIVNLGLKTNKKYDLYIEFPFGLTSKKNVFNPSDADNLPKPFLFNSREKKYALYENTKHHNIRIFPLDSGDIKIKVVWDNNKVMNIEMAIPFKTIFKSTTYNLSNIKNCQLKIILNAFDRATAKPSGKGKTIGSATDLGDLDEFDKSNGGRSAGTRSSGFRQQYEEFTKENITNNRSMYNKGVINQSVQIATPPSAL